MLRYAKIPLIFLFIGSLLGVFLRLQFVAPTPGITYSFFLHGHSHIMFLGWVFNVFYIAFTENHIAKSEQRFFSKLFVALQILTAGMLIAFPIQGYALYSILFSTCHTFIAVAWCVVFFKRTKGKSGVSLLFARIALIFFIISNIGPFLLGYFMSAGMAHSQWYYFSIYFYLHFQYNGFFLFGILSVLFYLLESREIIFDFKKAKFLGILLATMCVPTYLLSTLWAKPGLAFNAVAGLSALIQILSIPLIIRLIKPIIPNLKQQFNSTSKILLIVAFASFIIKLGLQFISASPVVAQLAYELRPVVIAYLHLVLLGIISLVLLVWYGESGMALHRNFKLIIALLLLAFAGMELGLIASPWWSHLFGTNKLTSSMYLLLCSALLSLSCFLLSLLPFKKMTKVMN